MTDEKPSILARFGGEVKTERDPEMDREAREFTEAMMREAEAAREELPIATFEFDPHRVDVAFHAAKWYIPSALAKLFDWNGRVQELYRTKRAVANDPNLPWAERREKMRAIEQRIGSLRQMETLLDGAFTYTTHGWQMYREDVEALNRICSALLAAMKLAKKGRRSLGIRVLDAEGKDVLDEVGL